MIVLIEGNEGTGKTTLINELSKQIPFAIVKYPKEFKDTFNLLETFAVSDRLFVLDRSFVSDIVYRRLDHQKGQMNLEQIGRLCEDRKDRMKIVFCNHDKAFENAMRRGEDNIKVESVHKLLDNEFYSVKNLLRCFTDIETFDYNYDYTSVEDVLKFIRRDWNVY